MKIADAIKYISEIPYNKKNHDSWMELWKKDSQFRYAACAILQAVWDGHLEEKNEHSIILLDCNSRVSDLGSGNVHYSIKELLQRI